MHKHNLIIIAVLALAAFGCKRQATVFKEIQASGKFTMQVPHNMNATDELFPGNKSGVQYKNDSLQMYLVVYDTGRQYLADKTLQDYYDSVVAEPTITNAVINTPTKVMINGDSAMVTEMTGLLDNVPMYYKIGVLINAQQVFYILLWCPQDKKDALKPDIDKILNSFTDINHIKV